MRIAVIGHVEHITLGRVAAVPAAGEIAHVESPRAFAGGGGGVAFHQLVRSPADIELFTAVGHDEAGRFIADELATTRARVHAAQRAEAHTRDVVMITPGGERTIVVVGEPLHPRHDDPLPWSVLSQCDAAYFTAQDPDVLRMARSARRLIVTARRREALDRSGVRADVVVGSAHDARENAARTDYRVAPDALVLTEGSAGGRVETATGTTRFTAPTVTADQRTGGAYGAGDSFAGALVFYLAAGLPIAQACERAGLHGAAVLQGLVPQDHQRALTLP